MSTTSTTPNVIFTTKGRLPISIKRLSPHGYPPTQGRDGDAGNDLYSAEEDHWLRPGERKLFKTDIAMAIPPGYVGLIWDRSGLAAKNGITVLGGVIDETYRGNIGVVLLNTNSGDETQSVKIERGQRIAQLIIQKYEAVEWKEMSELDETSRGQGGWGSSGA